MRDKRPSNKIRTAICKRCGCKTNTRKMYNGICISCETKFCDENNLPSRLKYILLILQHKAKKHLNKPLKRGHTTRQPHKPTEYCDKFDNACRERIRNKYDRMCFYCGKDEYTNNAKLSVHHLDMNKDQGCNGNEWRLVPLCRTCHGKAHTDTMTAKLKAMYAQIVN